MKHQKGRVKDRKGQPAFRSKMLELYSAKCCITDTDVREVLEAAHIQEYVNEESNHCQNGLLLRNDIHELFDSGLMTIDESYMVRVSPVIKDSIYSKLDGKKIRLPLKSDEHPSKEALKLHREIIYRK